MSRTVFPAPSELLPHAEPAVLIDEVLTHSADSIEVAAYITPRHPYFVADLGVPSWVGIELMAQAVAIHAGLGGREIGRGPRAGLLLGTRRYRSTMAWFPDGARLVIRAEREFGGQDGFAACDCEAYLDGKLCTEATIIIAEVSAEQFTGILQQ